MRDACCVDLVVLDRCRRTFEAHSTFKPAEVLAVLVFVQFVTFRESVLPGAWRTRNITSISVQVPRTQQGRFQFQKHENCGDYWCHHEVTDCEP